MNISELSEILGYCDTANVSAIVKGPHGIGKSQITMQYAKTHNMHCEQLILSLMDTADLLGMPIVEKVGGTTATVWAAPSWYSRIVNAAWPVEIKVDRLTFNDQDFEQYFKKAVAERTVKDIIGRETVNNLYCEYYDVPNDRLHILTQNMVGYADAKRSVLFLDEFNRSPVDVLNASLQLVLDKRLNDHVLPVVNGMPTLVVAAVNPDGGDYTVNSMDPAMMDRFAEFEAESHLQSWLEYARSIGVNPLITDYLTEYPDRLHFTPADGGTTATPRSWTALSRFVDKFETTKKEHQFPIIKGMVGSEVGSQFLQFMLTYSKAVKFADLEKMAKKALKDTENDVEKAAKKIEKIVKSQEPVKQLELAAQFFEKYIPESLTTKDIKEADQLNALPCLTFLYAMPLEQSAAFLLAKRGTDIFTVAFAGIDAYTGKALLKKTLKAARNDA